jgi:hypothetical protein
MNLPKPPPWMADLPPMPGFPDMPAPVDSAWESGKPLKIPDSRKTCALGIRRRCWVCGYPLPPGPPVYVIATEGGATDSHFVYPGGLYAQKKDGPLHASCTFYAAIVCPYLRYRTSRRLRDTANLMRGQAIIVGFNHYGLFQPPAHNRVVFGYFDIAEEIRLPNKSGSDIHAKYTDAVEADRKLKFTTTERISLTDSPADRRRLDAMLEADETNTAIMFATNRFGRGSPDTIVGGHPYRIQLL